MNSVSVLLLMLCMIFLSMVWTNLCSNGGLMSALVFAQVGSLSASKSPPQKMSCFLAEYHVWISG